MTSALAKRFLYNGCVKAIKGIVEPYEELLFYEQVELVKSLRFLAKRLNARGESEAEVTATARIGWEKFRKCGNRFIEDSSR